MPSCELLVKVTDERGRVKHHALDQDCITIGSHPKNDVVIDSPQVGSCMCRIFRKDNRYYVVDLFSDECSLGFDEIFDMKEINNGFYFCCGSVCIEVYINWQGGLTTESTDYGQFETELYERYRRGEFSGFTLWEQYGPEAGRGCQVGERTVVGSGPNADLKLDDPAIPEELAIFSGGWRRVKAETDEYFARKGRGYTELSLKDGDYFTLADRLFVVRRHSKKHPKLRRLGLYALLFAGMLGLLYGIYYAWGVWG